MQPLPTEVPAGPLVLRPWRAGDAEAVQAALTDPATDLWSNPGRVRTLEDARYWVARRADWSEGTQATWAVADAAGGRLCGSVSLHSIDLVQGDAEVGYWAVPAVRGRGLTARAVDAAVRWGFTALLLDRVELVHAVDNPASGRVAAKAGFTLEGRLRRSHRYGDGVRRDELLWARLADDDVPDLRSRPAR
ncbi:Protein N-acetyltransferase, RimJ/RimL family [Geodermatophilus telluris]|uniref:Protein N-acetyltransferase, RimJ/RimL family n=1 Tax=Geodermatophilus telluris TaxID=1190417 RepID=A0A1G6UEK6_9ACTN|nr:GNAT family protein [Geodermatophilus telluris]SDD39699.1 Protein N-acetyltransferase, RimJ/RimL family [Geodermatophilus telluris]